MLAQAMRARISGIKNVHEIWSRPGSCVEPHPNGYRSQDFGRWGSRRELLDLSRTGAAATGMAIGTRDSFA